MLDSLQDEGIIFSVSQLARLYSPVGLDIGADSLEEIAISILAKRYCHQKWAYRQLLERR